MKCGIGYPHNRTHRIVLLVSFFLAARTDGLGAQPLAKPGNPGAWEISFFENRIRPVLVERCFSCHGQGKHKGGLSLDSRPRMIEGGNTGPAIIPGDPQKSLLIRVLRQEEELKMPPKSRLSQREIADFAAWVKMGAPWPETTAKAATVTAPAFSLEQRSFWAFQAPRLPAIPSVRNRAWVQTPLDCFILAELEKRGWSPAPVADRQTLLRRATFDLTGLPPTLEETAAFLDDTTPGAFARVVDRLLASPQYGERWGRHWLDVARYADSNGMDENLVYGNAFRYRDYVVKAFNDDKAYDQFVREQIAGDLLPAATPEARRELWIATGFLSVGPKMLAEDDPVKMEMDIIDDQIDTLGRTFLGLTLGCARCHDHKFDPITMADYYSLAGIFKSTRTMDHFRVVARWHERIVASPAEMQRKKTHDAKVAEIKSLIRNRVQAANQRLLEEARRNMHKYLQALKELRRAQSPLVAVMAAGAEKIPGIILVEAENFSRGNVKKEFTGYGDKIGVIYNQGTLPNFAEYDLVLARSGTYQLELRHAAAEPRPVHLYVNGKRIKTDAAANATGTWYPDSQRWTAEAIVTLPAGKNTLRFEREQPFPHLDKLALVPCPSPERTTGLVPRTPEQVAHVYGINPVFLRQWMDFLAKRGKELREEALQKAANDAGGPFALSADLEGSYRPDERAELQRLRQKLSAREKRAPSLPEAMAVEEKGPVNVRIHLRGSHLTLGREVPRRFPGIFTGTRQAAIPDKQSGRLQLAQWLTQADQPLTARVMVNRIWRWHFGAGLVRSPDNFGLLGDRPVHQPLLDWLAIQFVNSGWSIKAMHRLIMLSRTYQMSTAYNEESARTDPDNRLHWRMERRRLEAEALRDAVLAVSGRLDRRMGGSLFEAKNREYVPGYPNASYAKYDSNRRSIYLPVIRSELYEVFQAFDFPDPSVANGDRASTTVAPQALFMMNSKFMQNQTQALAVSLLDKAAADDASRVTRAYARIYGRLPQPGETARALAFLRQIELALPENLRGAERRTRAWQSLCRVLLAANEFTYLN
jgi:mono/diheme cytochrome c family protein